MAGKSEAVKCEFLSLWPLGAVETRGESPCLTALFREAW